MTRSRQFCAVSVGWIVAFLPVAPVNALDPYSDSIDPLLRKYCFECHSGDLTEADINLGEHQTARQRKQNVGTWVKVRSMLDSRQMPPRDSAQPTDAEHRALSEWVRAFLAEEATANAGDPGAVVLRRLSNAEYTYTIRDLTGVGSLNPAYQFPVDGAAGEGFTNTGSGLVMSPSLVQKYLDAGKQIAKHAAFFPDGLRFSPHTSRRDLTDEWLAKIRAFYFRYAVDGMNLSANLHGGTENFDNKQAGLLPVAEYIKASLEERQNIQLGRSTVAEVAKARKLSAPYLQRLWNALIRGDDNDSFLLARVRDRFQKASVKETEAVVQQISSIQPLFWKFNIVGHIGREGAPQTWMEEQFPIAARQEFRLPLKTNNGKDVIVSLVSDNAGDGHDEHDYVFWRDMRLEVPGKPPIALRDARGIYKREQELRRQLIDESEEYLNAASDFDAKGSLKEVTQEHSLNPHLLQAWLTFLGMESTGPVRISGHFEKHLGNNDYAFVTGWGVPETPAVSANSSVQEVRVPGIARAHGLTVHPSPTEFVAIGWQSPVTAIVTIDAALSDAHPECGNGVEYAIQHRRSGEMNVLWNGEFATAQSAKMQTKTLSVTEGEVISVLVGPRQNNHSCDLTAVDLVIRETSGRRRNWDLSKDCSRNIQESNPHADSYSNKTVWHFYRGPMDEMKKLPDANSGVPAGSLLAKWRQTPADRRSLSRQISTLLKGPPPEDDAKNSPDGLVYQSIHNLSLPHDSALFHDIKPDPRFGKHPLGHKLHPDHIVVKAPTSLTFQIPAAIANGRELTVVGMHDTEHGLEGTTRVLVTAGTISSIEGPVPIICADVSDARKRIQNAMADFRNLFPAALCYTRIVPVDEVVTATLMHREDRLFQSLMLNPEESQELDRLWNELRYISEEPLKAVVALEQIREFSTQDRPDAVGPWDRMKPSVAARAEAFRAAVTESEPRHLESVLDFADRAWRRPLTDHERAQITELYKKLRASNIDHEESIQLTIARVLTSPAFLYRREVQRDSSKATAVSDYELASRLSYFLWSSAPDTDLRMAAQQNRLTQSSDDELLRQTKRLLTDTKSRRLAIHFACQWLHLRNFDQNDDKNEKLYPNFKLLRSDMYEETVQFFEDMFRNNGSILDVLDANHTFLNEALAQHYGVPGITGEEWRRFENLHEYERGGVLAMATFLASQSGASRTSPILRGNWLSETLLGEKLPKPPANVPQLPAETPTGLTARQLIEQHSSNPACAKCHAKIDPYGFALEQFDAIGRRRPNPADTKTTLYDGTNIDGLIGLQKYLLTRRKADFVRQFCKKLLGFALAREVLLSDEPLINDMMQKLEANGHRFHTAVEAVVSSPQFLKIRGSRDRRHIRAAAR